MTLWERIKYAFRVLWEGAPERPPWVDGIISLDHTDLTGCIKTALDKLENEPVYPGRARIADMAKGPEKYREVLKWVWVYAKQLGFVPKGHVKEEGQRELSMSHVNFMIEFLLMERKGKI